MTAYIVDMALPLPGIDAHERIVSEPVEFTELLECYFGACREAMSTGYVDGDHVPYWHVRAVEDDGSERPLTPVEHAALEAQFEQAFWGWKAVFRAEGKSEETTAQ